MPTPSGDRRLHDDGTAAFRLREARMRAGFASGRAAAMTFSWPESSYRAHEAGTRRPAPEQLAAYLAAFDSIPRAAVSATRDLREVASHLKRRGGDPRTAARRLLLARRLAGFVTAAGAIEFYGWNDQTYYAHESGRHRMPRDTARIYAAAFGVSPLWLSSGEGPSGLATERHPDLDALAAEFAASSGEQIPEKLLQAASAERRAADKDSLPAPADRAAGVERAITPRGTVLDVVVERPPSVPGSAARERGWGFPADFVTEVWHAQPQDLCVIAITTDVPDAGLRAGDRVVADAADTELRTGHLFAVRHGKTGAAAVRRTSAASGKSPDVLGRVVARLVREG